MFFEFFRRTKRTTYDLPALARSDDIVGLRNALQDGANIDMFDTAMGETALHTAVAIGNRMLVQILLAKGANPNLVSRQHLTPLLIAVSAGDAALPLVELLLAGRADPNLAPQAGPNAGRNALTYADAAGFYAISQHLLTFGVERTKASNAATTLRPTEKIDHVEADVPLAYDNPLIRGMTLLEFGDTYFDNVRFRNALTRHLQTETLPFASIGDYLDAGEQGRRALSGIPNLGMTSLDGLDRAILGAMRQPANVLPPRQEDAAITVTAVSALAPTEIPEVRSSWQVMYERLVAYQQAHGDCNVPHRWPEDAKLAAWVSAQRQKYKKGDVSPEQIAMFETIGFVWALRERGSWEDRLQELAQFKQVHGHFDIPSHYPAAPKLKQFVASTRYQYRHGELESDRVQSLQEIGFPWMLRDSQQPTTLTSGGTIATGASDGFSFAGRTLAITGRLENCTRDAAISLAQQLGATVVDKYSEKVDVLLVGFEPGTKLQAAVEHGIPIIDESDFHSLLRRGGIQSTTLAT